MEREILTGQNRPEIYGLVLAGGYSQRMGMDKAFILYQGKPMYHHAARLIQTFCREVIISCRKEQKELITGYPVLLDSFPSKGPMTGLLSAFKKYPKVAWLLIPVDMPNLTTQFINEYLLANRDSRCDATIIRDQPAATIQPLVAIYEPTSLKKVEQQYVHGFYSLKGMVDILQVHFVDFRDVHQYLANYNNPEDWSELRGLQ
ncbi:MAG: molybdenum cofactor guanylyltransferase [Saprospiraceae bacterium]|nr:molybdenum cofactor guanylyltransferase [Saprospiraceae bacterium]